MKIGWAELEIGTGDSRYHYDLGRENPPSNRPSLIFTCHDCEHTNIELPFVGSINIHTPRRPKQLEKSTTF